jgi:cell division transport system ATP-binding protein
MIRLHNASKYFHPQIPVLQEISFSIHRGEFVFVTGASGAGKTTLLRLLYGAERADEGQVVVEGRNLGRLRSREIARLRRRIGIVFQDFKLIPYRTVYENVGLPLRVRGVAEKELKRRVWEALKEVGMTTKVDVFPPALSGGEQQRVALARALIANPSLVLADEPTGNLDPDLTWAILDLLVEANRRGATVVVATHDKSIIEGLRRRTLTLVRGRLVSDEG